MYWMIAAARWVFPWLVSFTPAYAQDDLAIRQNEALKLIRDTASDICYTVQQQGQQTDQQLSGDVNVQLNSIISRVIDLDAKASAKIQDQGYQGLLRKDLASAIKSSADCKKEVFIILVERIFPRGDSSLSQKPTEGAPDRSLPPIKSARILDNFEYNLRGRLSFSLYRCVNDKEAIVCTFILNKLDGVIAEYNFEDFSRKPAKLIDNFLIEHRMIGGNFINGRGQEQMSVSLGKGVSTWFSLEFDGPSDDITSAHIVLPFFGNRELRGPVQ